MARLSREWHGAARYSIGAGIHLKPFQYMACAGAVEGFCAAYWMQVSSFSARSDHDSGRPVQ
ncbi:hypothetical protein ACRALDRAFT_1059869 [Sodiomyces alcalophilus JCM 7366]|uniref:uncharacterized protein n=1 Tax=Sodiomyces alcalophilus JCM 7366 TaxID=591952 RepID=UPI0039B45A6B